MFRFVQQSLSERVSWIALSAFLVISIPPLICMPLWCDATYYDFVAWNLQQGKVLYLDIWDINFPGMSVLQSLVRAAFGFSVEALHLVDLLVVATITFLALRLVSVGRTNSARLPIALCALLVAVFYTAIAESCHCQRDVWMLVPILLALNIRRATQLSAPAATTQFRLSLIEGAVWGVGVWIKPHVVCIGIAVWLHSVVWKTHRRTMADTCGLLCGGLLLGIIGCGLLVQFGAWTSFWEIMLQWNPDYVGGNNTIARKLHYYTIYGTQLMPWSLMIVAAIVGSLWVLGSERNQFRTSRQESQERADVHQGTAASLLAATLLGWVLQAVLLQRPHDYVVTATWLLSLGTLLAVFDQAQQLGRWQVVAWTIIVVSLPSHAALNPRRLALWHECVQQGSTPMIRQQLSMMTGVGKTDWPDLKLIQRYLERLGVTDEDVTCFSISTHPLYHEMKVNAPTKYPYLDTLFYYHASQRSRIARNVYQSRHKYVVADVWSSGMENHPRAQEIDGIAHDLPQGFPPERLTEFPWNQPLLIRAGRYTVHRVLPENRLRDQRKKPSEPERH